MEKSVQIPQDAPLNERDTEMQTYGCRHSNPDICKLKSAPSICAFANDDKICRNPPRSWKKIYVKLLHKDK